MPVIYIIELCSNQPVNLKIAANIIGDNTKLSKFLSNCGCEIILQEPFSRILIHIKTIYLFDKTVAQIAFNYMVNYLNDLGLSREFYVSGCTNSPKPFDRNAFLPVMRKETPVFTITLKPKSAEMSLYREAELTVNEIIEIADEIEELLNMRNTLRINLKYDHAQENYYLNFMNLGLKPGTQEFLLFVGDIILQAVINKNLYEKYSIENFDEDEYMKVSANLRESNFYKSASSAKNNILSNLTAEDLALYSEENTSMESGQANSQSPRQSISQMNINSPIHSASDAHASLLKELEKIIDPNDKKRYEFFMDSIQRRAYSQALRRLCTSDNQEDLAIVKILFKYKGTLQIDPNEKAGKENPRAAVHHAAEKNEAIYLFLRENGGNQNLKDNYSTAEEIYQSTLVKNLNTK